MILRKWKRSATILVIFLAFVGWAEAAPLKVIASWSILEDVIRNVGKIQVEAHALAPRGIELHDIELTMGDQVRMSEADLLVWLGLPLETWLHPYLQRIADDKQLQLGKHLQQLLPGIKEDHEEQEDHPDEMETIEDHEEEEDQQTAATNGDMDLHVWHDVSMMIQVTDLIAQELARRDPQHVAYYRGNALEYTEILQRLDAWIHEQLAFIPQSRRLLVTSHLAFEYFGRAYHFRTLAPHGIGGEDQLGPRMLQKIIAEIKKEEARVIFPEEHVNPLLAQIAREAEITIQESLNTGNLTSPGTPAGTYVGFMKENIRVLSQAFRKAYKLYD